MAPRLDAHAHFFYPGFVGALPENARRINPDEITLYTAYVQQHEIEQVLAVGYEGGDWATGNNQYIADLAAKNSWIRPIAFVGDPTQLTIAQLQAWQSQNFVGISLYIFDEAAAERLSQASNDIWQWLIDHAWLISVNSTGEHWAAWHSILAKHPQLCLLVAHLGLPPAATSNLTPTEAQAALANVLALAQYPQVYIKFSGLYALAEPGHEYPHRLAWPYAQTLTETFGVERILWASDFSPALETVSFAQTVGVLTHLTWLSQENLNAIYYDNLSRLLTAVEQRKP